MEEFEGKLKRLRLCQPSAELDERVLGQQPGSRQQRQLLGRRRVSLGIAIAACAVVGLLGFIIGLGVRSPIEADDVERSAQPTVHKIYYVPISVKQFDFTQESIDPPMKHYRVDIQMVNGGSL